MVETWVVQWIRDLQVFSSGDPGLLGATGVIGQPEHLQETSQS